MNRVMTNKAGLAKHLGKSLSTLGKLMARMEKEGFPRRDPLLGGWHLPSVEDWLRRRANFGGPTVPPTQHSSGKAALLTAIRMAGEQRQ